MLNTRHSVRSVPGRSVVVYEVARGFSGGQEFATSINVANEDSVTGVTELGVQQALRGPSPPFSSRGIYAASYRGSEDIRYAQSFNYYFEPSCSSFMRGAQDFGVSGREGQGRPGRGTMREGMTGESEHSRSKAL